MRDTVCKLMIRKSHIKQRTAKCIFHVCRSPSNICSSLCSKQFLPVSYTSSVMPSKHFPIPAEIQYQMSSSITRDSIGFGRRLTSSRSGLSYHLNCFIQSSNSTPTWVNSLCKNPRLYSIQLLLDPGVQGKFLFPLN